jgi:hypothetical protein
LGIGVRFAVIGEHCVHARQHERRRSPTQYGSERLLDSACGLALAHLSLLILPHAYGLRACDGVSRALFQRLVQAHGHAGNFRLAHVALRDLPEPNLILSYVEKVGRMREGKEGDQRLEVEAIRNLDRGGDRSRQSEELDRVESTEHGQAFSQMVPEPQVVRQTLRVRLHSPNPTFVRACAVKLGDRLPDKVLEEDLILLGLAADRVSWEVDRHAMIGADLIKATEIRFRKRVDMQHSLLLYRLQRTFRERSKTGL